MNLTKALRLLKQGNIIRHRYWDKDDREGYLELRAPDSQFANAYGMTEFGEYFSIEYMDDNDWEIFEPKKKRFYEFY
jgi:hypothetical protein